jgi:glycosyltransferase involved in cell wall biosynthesis
VPQVTDSSPISRPNTLFVSAFSPHPLTFGGAIRLHNLMRTVHEFSDVSLISFCEWEDPETRAVLGEFCDEIVFVPGRSRPRWQLQARSLLSLHSFQHLNHRSKSFQRALTELLTRSSFDVVVTEMSQMASYDLSPAPPVRVLDMQNIEHELVRRRAGVSGKGARRLALELEWRKLRREELDACRRFDLVFIPSDREQALVSSWVPGTQCVAVPNTIDPDRLPQREAMPARHEVVFIGLTHVDANRDGVRWFVDAVLPLLERRVPDVHVSIVGGTPPPDIARLGSRPNIDVTGYVPEIAPYLQAAAVSIVPLRSGGGTRLKILESLSVGVPTVSTTIGAEGLDVVDGTHIRIADEPATFADAVAELMLDQETQRRLSEAGRALVESKYSWRAQRQHVEGILRERLSST